MKKLTKALLGLLIGAAAACSVAAFAACEQVSVHVHEWADDYTVDVAATCTEDGSKSIHCKSCNETKDITVIEATGHVWATEYTVDAEPTCTEAGSKSYHCTIDGCNGTNESTEIAATGHVWATEYTIDAQPTCTEAGSKSKHCTVEGCNGTNESTEIAATGHVWSEEYTVDFEPTCIEIGSKSKHCTVEGCGATGESVEILATGHLATEYAATQSTCAVKGHDAYWQCENCEKYFSDADCLSSIDAPVEYALAEHTYDWFDSQKNYQAATCTEDGHQSYYACTVCDAKFAGTDGVKLLNPISDEDWIANYEIPAAHASVTQRTVKAATCTANGYSQSHFYCSKCKSSAWDREFMRPMTSEEVTAVTIKSLGHDYSDEWTVDTAATCSKVGYQSHHCTRTGCSSYTGRTTINMLPHTWDESEYVIDVAATCQAAGSKSYHCSECGATNADSAVAVPVDENAHAWSARYFALTPATCMAEGTHTKYCMLCGEQQAPTTAPVDPYAHTFASEWTVDVEPTCTTSGSKSLHCTVEGCDGQSHVTQIPTLGHNYEWQFDGLNGTSTCTNGCGDTNGTYTLPAEAAGKTVNNVVEVDAAGKHWDAIVGANFVSATQNVHYMDIVADKSGTYLFSFEYLSTETQLMFNSVSINGTSANSKATITRVGAARSNIVSVELPVLAGETISLYLSVNSSKYSNYIMKVELTNEIEGKSLSYGNNTVNVTVSNNTDGVDSYTFTPDETKTYGLTVPEGVTVGIGNKPLISSGTYADFEATKGKAIVFSFTHEEVGEYTVTIGEMQPKVLELGTAVAPSLQGHTLVGYKVADGVAPGKYTLTFTGQFLMARKYPYGYLWLQVNGSGDYNDMTDDNSLYIHAGATTDKPGYECNCKTTSSWTVTLELTAGDVIYLTLDKSFGENYKEEGSASVLSMTLTKAA